ncbi:MAG: hypothetical protein Q9184_004181 [Pyrenodesmia sp. 2 TL-2023]
MSFIRQSRLTNKRPYDESDESDDETSSSAETSSEDSDSVAEAEPYSKRRKTGLLGSFATPKQPPEVLDVDYEHMIPFLHPDTVRRLLLQAANESPTIASAIIAYHYRIARRQKRKIRDYDMHVAQAKRAFSRVETMHWKYAWSMAFDISYSIQESVKIILLGTRALVRWGTKKNALRTLVELCQMVISKHGTECGERVCKHLARHETLENALLQVMSNLTDSQKERWRREKQWERDIRGVMQWGKKHKMFKKIKDVLRALGLKVRGDEMKEEEEEEETEVDKAIRSIFDEIGVEVPSKDTSHRERPATE